jgi:signal transduction histidine kinase
VQKARTARDQNQRMFHELQTTHRQLQSYADQVGTLAIEHERNRLARELHDSVTQTVFSMNLAAQSAHLVWEKEPPRVAGQLLHLEDLAASAQQEIHTLISQLRPRPGMDLGLPAALQQLASEHQAREGLQVSLEILREGPLPETVAANLYDIAHEALINVSRHSGTCDAIVRLHLDKDHPSLEIEDHGRGFEPNAAPDQRGHLGLTGMLERAREIGWQFSVCSRPGQGTRVRVTSGPPGGSG